METEIRMTDRKRTMIFINIVNTCIASSMLATALTTALPAIISDLEISVTAGQWLTTAFFWMTIVTILLVLMGIFFVKKKE